VLIGTLIYVGSRGKRGRIRKEIEREYFVGN